MVNVFDITASIGPGPVGSNMAHFPHSSGAFDEFPLLVILRSKLLFARELLVERQVELQYIYPGLTKKAEIRAFGEPGDQLVRLVR